MILRYVVREVSVEGSGDDTGVRVGIREVNVLAVVLRGLGSPTLKTSPKQAPSRPCGHCGGGGGGGRTALTLVSAVASQEHPRKVSKNKYLRGCEAYSI